MARAARDFFKDFDVLTHENRNFRSAPESLSHRQGHLLRPPGETICLVLLMLRSLTSNGESRLYKTDFPQDRYLVDELRDELRMIAHISNCN